MTPEQTKFLLRIRAQREECGCPPLTDEDWVILGNRELRVTNSHQCGLEDHGRWYVPPSGSANTEPYPLCQLTVGDLRAKLLIALTTHISSVRGQRLLTQQWQLR